MNLPPLIARVRVRTRRHAFRLWVPLFLLWILLVPLLVPVILVALLVTAVAMPRWRCGALLRGAWATLCETRGTRVEVEDQGTRVFVTLH
jgi:hypothetical protein